MGRLRLTVATVVAEHAAPLAIAIFTSLVLAVAVLLVAIAIAIPIVGVGPRIAFLANSLGLFVPAAVVLIFKTARALGRDPYRERAFRVERSKAPALYALSADVARSLGFPAPASIWLASQFEASARGTRLHCDLMLGLALLDTLDVDELRARIATTLLSSYAGDPLTARAYRVATYWIDVLSGATSRASGALEQFVAAICLGWFDFKMLRERQRAGAEDARRHLGKRNVDAALARPALYEVYADEMFWPGLLARHIMNVQPPDAVSQLRALCRTAIEPSAWKKASESLQPLPGIEHLAAEDVHHEQWSPASRLLTREVDHEATARFDLTWRTGVAVIWKELSRVAHAQEQELAALEARLPELTEDDAWRRLELVEVRRGADAALPLMRDWLLHRPEDARAAFHAGRAAMATDANDAVSLLERASALDDRFEPTAYQLIGSALIRRGEQNAGAKAYERALAAADRIRYALQRRVKKIDARRLGPHGLAEHDMITLREHLAKYPMIATASASRMRCEEMPTIPCVIVAIRFGRWWAFAHGEQKSSVLAGIGAVDLPMQIHAVDIGLRKRALGRAPATEVYRRAVEPRSLVLARWGRRAQRALIGLGILLVLLTAVTYRDCFPECWEDVSALLVFGPMIFGVNALLLTGSPDTPRQRSVAFATSAFFAGMFVFGGLFVLVVPVAVAGLLRVPITKGWATWAVAMSVPAFLVGWMVTIV